MTQEEKAKAYDEAIRKLRGMMPNWDRLSYNGNTFIQDLIYIFPELAESEDEKIKKEIAELVMQPTWKTEKEFHRRKELCDWLEKQGEQNPTDKTEPKFKVGDKIKFAKEPKYPAREIISIKNDCYYFDSAVYLPFESQDDWELVEQKPTWSKEDERIYQSIIDDNLQENLLYNEQINWIISIKQRIS